MNYYFDTFPTPAGDFSVVLDDNGSVAATTFGGITRLRKQFKPASLIQDATRAAKARLQVQEFFAGKRKQFELPLAPKGTPFQKRVWGELQRIPFGETRSYAQLAVAVGRPGAARAVGQANGANPICLIVPCHRVIAADGTLGGFGLGLNLKRQLLNHEQGNGSCAPGRQLTAVTRMRAGWNLNSLAAVET